LISRFFEKTFPWLWTKIKLASNYVYFRRVFQIQFYFPPKYNFLNNFTGLKDDDMDFQKVFYGLFDRISFKFTRYLEPQSYLVVKRTNMQMLKNSQRS